MIKPIKLFVHSKLTRTPFGRANPIQTKMSAVIYKRLDDPCDRANPFKLKPEIN